MKRANFIAMLNTLDLQRMIGEISQDEYKKQRKTIIEEYQKLKKEEERHLQEVEEDKEFLEYLEKGGKPRESDFISKESEEDVIYIPNIGKIPKSDKIKMTFNDEKPEIIQLTKEAYKKILERLDKLEKLESIRKMNNFLDDINKRIEETKDGDYITLNKESKTADEMFTDMGYICVQNEFTNGQYFIRYDFPMINGTRIIKIADGEYECYCKILDRVYECYIKKEEDIAIHKKIEELKNEK